MKIKNIICVGLIFFLSIACEKIINSKTRFSPSKSATDYMPDDTLRVVTQYGATSFFVYRDDTLGYDYEMAVQVAKHLDIPLKISVVSDDSSMVAALEDYESDIVCYQTTKTKSLQQKFSFLLDETPSHLVLVQLIDRDAISDISDLSGKKVWVKKNTPHHRRLLALNEEIGGDIEIKLSADSLHTDALMERVIRGEIPYTLAYRHKALLQKQFSRQVDVRIPVGLSQDMGWMVRTSNRQLYDTLHSFLTHFLATERHEAMLLRYWDKNPYFLKRNLHIPKDGLSPFDAIFKKYAKRIDWDWRLLAAVAYAESGFENHLVSWAGARGIMQLMPATAREFGLPIEDVNIPDLNIKAGVEYIKSLDMVYQKIENKEERIKFILASYNAGPAHILDAMALAEKYGKNKHIWFDNVEHYLSRLNDSAYYHDEVVKYGRFKAYETLRYVPFVLDTYVKYLKKK